MKLRLSLLLLCAIRLLAEPDSTPAPSMRTQLAEEIRKQVTYTPPPAKPSIGSPEAGDDEEIVVLDTFVATTTTDAFAHKIEERQQKAQAEEFTFQNGGACLKIEGKRVTTEVKFRYDWEHGGWDILSFSW